MNIHYKFREAKPKDIPACKQIRDHVTENILVSRSIDIQDYQRAFFTEGKAWVCEHRGQVVGFSCGRHVYKDIWALFVQSDYEGQGIGNELMNLAETWMFDVSCPEITLFTEAGTRAEKLYLKRLWRVVGYTTDGDVQFTLSRSC